MTGKLALVALTSLLTACGQHIAQPCATTDEPHDWLLSTYWAAHEVLEPFCRDCDLRPAHDPDAAFAEIVIWEERGAIYYSEADLADVDLAFGRPAVLSIFAHEIGHMIEYRLGHRKPKICTDDIREICQQNELDADDWAGCALARHSDSTEAAHQFYAHFAIESTTHPGAQARSDALETGYARCAL